MNQIIQSYRELTELHLWVLGIAILLTVSVFVRQIRVIRAAARRRQRWLDRHPGPDDHDSFWRP